ncbi:rab effector MyRIP-like [Amblyraja radiata]|uniref:rab effector MyRIP-like n=1 Tax=Amblyraja radiata TaxID=386614 RepID=UPI001403A9A1|nr:rab effector MyRIP-like [Amblyraja radiata]
MGKKLDLTALTEDEAEHVLQVVQRDFHLRKKEQERLSELKQKLNEEGNKRTILSKQQKFNENCCIRCCGVFTFLLNAKHPCSDCKFNVCRDCGTYSKKDKAWVCTVCHQTRLLRAQSLEWYYNNVKGRFKHFGSAKVVHTLYKRRLAGTGSPASTLGGSVLGSSVDYEERVGGCMAYRQTDGHTLSETLAVALRVAEEAIEEAITKADSFSDSLEKQSESQYLQEHKEDLIEELATTIMQKVIKRKKSGGGLTDSESEPARCQRRSSARELLHPSPDCQAESSTLWRSQSELCLTQEELESREGAEEGSLWRSESAWSQAVAQPSQHLDIRPYSLPEWQSMELLDNAGPSTALHSPDGNWMAVSCRRPTPARLLTKPKGRDFAGLEREAGVRSAYEEMGGDEADWGSVMGPRPEGLPDPTPSQLAGPTPEPSTTCPLASPHLRRHHAVVPETSSGGLVRISVTGPEDRGLVVGDGDYDLNFNTREPSPADSSDDQELPDRAERRQRRRKRSKSSSPEQTHKGNGASTRQTATPKNTCQELSRCMLVMERSLARLERRISLGSWSQEESPAPRDKDKMAEDEPGEDVERKVSLTKTEVDQVEKVLKSRMVQLITKLSDKESSSGDDLDLESTEAAQETSSCDEDRKHIQDELVRKYSAISLCSITTEALKVLGATEELIEGASQEGHSPTDPTGGKGPTEKEAQRLQAHLSKLEENVYITAGTVYGLEGQLNDLEECARSIHSLSTETKLSDLEDQVATAAAQVHQAELQVSDIERRISALNVAGLNVVACERLLKKRSLPDVKAETIDTSRQQRRKLPAPPSQGTSPSSLPGIATVTASALAACITRQPPFSIV